MKQTQKDAIRRLTDRIDNLRSQNAALLEALSHATNWAKGYGFPEEHKPVWMPQAEEAIRKAGER